jgi:glycosyltransferase involved in cell wall biosynthesis
VEHYGVAPSRARRIPNLADPQRLIRLAAEHRRAPENGTSICIVTRLHRRKRVDTLLAAAAGLPADRDWRIDVAGDGEQRGELEAMAARLGIGHRVTFHGWQPNPHPLVARAAASVLCSEFEGFSNAVLEAMALGTPVVTSLCTSDAAEMVGCGAALGFPVGDDEALRIQLARLLGDAALRRPLQEAARQYITRHILPAAILEYEQLVHDAIGQRGRSAVAAAEASAALH